MNGTNAAPVRERRRATAGGHAPFQGATAGRRERPRRATAGRRERFRRALLPLAAALAVGLTACEKPEFERPDRSEQVREARMVYSAAMFDSVTWASDSIRALEGNVVYSTYCRNCHGPLGMGGTDYALERELDVPSLVTPDWRYSEDADSVHLRVFVGHAEGMPTWGVAGLSAREIDAVTHYLLEVLRPEVVGGGGG